MFGKYNIAATALMVALPLPVAILLLVLSIPIATPSGHYPHGAPFVRFDQNFPQPERQ